MKYVVKIDRETVKKNPHAGETVFYVAGLRMLRMQMSSRLIWAAAKMLLTDLPARPTKGSPFWSSSLPGASPQRTIFVFGLPTPKTVLVRVEANSLALSHLLVEKM